MCINLSPSSQWWRDLWLQAAGCSSIMWCTVVLVLQGQRHQRTFGFVVFLKEMFPLVCFLTSPLLNTVPHVYRTCVTRSVLKPHKHIDFRLELWKENIWLYSVWQRRDKDGSAGQDVVDCRMRSGCCLLLIKMYLEKCQFIVMQNVYGYLYLHVKTCIWPSASSPWKVHWVIHHLYFFPLNN